ncbi:uncharacterized protein SPAPADRAFT_55170 [Spathaspora passalidarum NRRL Y-27907]|uniref:GRAM domain-containing protein n=1 Tax=Spathaspora passalidarum (strain NRRL Y-27907 / 11-Y1) TaxID=619300 RepID=G3ALN0_SPAPN|nr:uncharacterized protein SPAPADRAFT_55170 [Spathaspora passalidarum NRRL Y-27907]EGW33273.1 hypothetical protein SPAPADRAFT_55170 [Spathaspora passalidarum NRRL Y-27907]
MSINNIVLKNNYASLLGSSAYETPFELSGDGLEILKYHTSTPRQTLTITQKDQSENHHLKVTAKDGFVYLTNKRLVFITSTQGDMDTFSIDLNLAPVLQLSHKLQAPWFGPNYWEFMFYSAAEPQFASDGFPKNQYFKGEIRFHDGGLFTFVDLLNKVVHDCVNNREIDEELPQYSA